MVVWRCALSHGVNQTAREELTSALAVEGCPAPHFFNQEETCDLLSCVLFLFSAGLIPRETY
jgi:hypothetical protein